MKQLKQIARLGTTIMLEARGEGSCADCGRLLHEEGFLSFVTRHQLQAERAAGLFPLKFSCIHSFHTRILR